MPNCLNLRVHSTRFHLENIEKTENVFSRLRLKGKLWKRLLRTPIPDNVRSY